MAAASDDDRIGVDFLSELENFFGRIAEADLLSDFRYPTLIRLRAGSFDAFTRDRLCEFRHGAEAMLRPHILSKRPFRRPTVIDHVDEKKLGGKFYREFSRKVDDAT